MGVVWGWGWGVVGWWVNEMSICDKVGGEQDLSRDLCDKRAESKVHAPHEKKEGKKEEEKKRGKLLFL